MFFFCVDIYGLGSFGQSVKILIKFLIQGVQLLI